VPVFSIGDKLIPHLKKASQHRAVGTLYEATSDTSTIPQKDRLPTQDALSEPEGF